MMTTIDLAEMIDGTDYGVTGWLDASAVDQFCRELMETRLMVTRASLRLAAQWPDFPAFCQTDLPVDGTKGNVEAHIETDVPQKTPGHDGSCNGNNVTDNSGGRCNGQE